MLTKNIYKYISLAIISISGGVLIYYAGLSVLTLFEITPDRPGCETPIYWSFTNYDDRFPLSKKEFFFTVFEAEKIWENIIGKDLFVFNNSSSFEIKTKFDKRQERTYATKNIDEQLDNYENSTKPLENKYYSLKKQYNINLQNFNLSVDAFEKDLASYNKSVKKWNKSDKTSKSKYEKIKSKGKKLEIEQKSLAKKESKLSALVDNINRLSDQLNIQTDVINKKIETFKEKYGEATPFIQGHYVDNFTNITIFQFQDENDLKLVLAHELGHALGIKEHVENPTSLMYYLMDEQNINNPKLSQEDIDAYYNSACPPRTFSQSEQLKRYLISTNWKDMKISKVLNILQISK